MHHNFVRAWQEDSGAPLVVSLPKGSASPRLRRVRAVRASRLHRSANSRTFAAGMESQTINSTVILRS